MAQYIIPWLLWHLCWTFAGLHITRFDQPLTLTAVDCLQSGVKRKRMVYSWVSWCSDFQSLCNKWQSTHSLSHSLLSVLWYEGWLCATTMWTISRVCGFITGDLLHLFVVVQPNLLEMNGWEIGLEVSCIKCVAHLLQKEFLYQNSND